MGRTPKPPSERALTGNPGKRGPRTRKPPTSQPPSIPTPDQPIDSSLQPPPWLTGEIAVSEWKRLSGHLQRSHVLADTDRTALGMYCTALQRWVLAQRDVEQNGMTFRTVSKHGELTRINPAFKIAESSAREVSRLGQQLGLGALSRFRLGGAAASVGVQLDLFGCVSNQVTTTHEHTPSSATPQESEADGYFGYGAAVH